MTLRYENGKPIGLDWPAITTESNPEAWRKAAAGVPAKDEAAPERDRRRLSPNTERKIIRLYRDDLKSAKETALACGVQSATVFKVLARNGIPSRSQAEGARLRSAHRAVENPPVSEQFL